MIFNQRVVQLTGRRIALTPPVNFTATPGNEQVSLTWEDPEDATSGGVVVAEWEFTQIVRKVGSPPVNQTDGTIVAISDVKNQYLSEPFVDTGLTNGTTYYYGAFACSKAGAWSDGAFAGAIPVASVALGSLAEGTLVKIKENGTPVEFYVGKQGYEPGLNGPNRVLMVRKDVYDQRQWDSNYTNAWASSTMLSWLNRNYKGLFSPNVQKWMGNTTYQYTPGSGENTVNTRSDAVFLLSVTELGGRNTYANVEGSVLPIANTIKIAYQNGQVTTQWTRSPYKNNTLYAWWVDATGDFKDGESRAAFGSRPCFTLPSTVLIDDDLNLIESTEPAPAETPLSDLAEGTLITIQESGVPVEFYIAKQNYEERLNGAGRVLCVRKDIQSNQVWDAGNVNAYATSDIDTWFNGTYKNTLSSNVQTIIGKTAFPSIPGNGNTVVSTLSRSVFSLSWTELGKPSGSVPMDGTALDIANVLQITPDTYQWTRTPYSSSSNNVYQVGGPNGGGGTANANLSLGARPCFTLPSTALVDGNLALIEGV